ncbi:MAG: 1-phosphofructokinase family hexose kinase [Treponema sp.]|jgi:1-phosphofructokinase|nr:1-phosphofructokinase family hexose kinase [Treponema sp.]
MIPTTAQSGTRQGTPPRVLTITVNPAIDETIRVEKLVPGEVHRASPAHLTAGGKGINVSACLSGWGTRTLAAGFLGRNNQAIFEDHLRRTETGDLFIRLPGDTRTNIKVVDGEGTTDINLPGPSLEAEDVRRLERLAGEELPPEIVMVIISGSLPWLCPADLYKNLVRLFKNRGCFVILDADGQALREALSSETLPDCIKPNNKELSRWAGRELSTTEEIAEAALDLCRRGVLLATVSMGARGVLFAGKDHIFHAAGEADCVFGTVGAGDAMVAGIAAALLEQWDLENPRPWESPVALQRMARLGTAFALAKLGSGGGEAPGRSVIEETAEKVAVKELFFPG